MHVRVARTLHRLDFCHIKMHKTVLQWTGSHHFCPDPGTIHSQELSYRLRGSMHGGQTKMLCVCINVYTCTYVCVYIYIYTYINVCVYIYIYISIYMDVYMHIYIYTHARTKTICMCICIYYSGHVHMTSRLQQLPHRRPTGTRDRQKGGAACGDLFWALRTECRKKLMQSPPARPRKATAFGWDIYG